MVLSWARQVAALAKKELLLLLRAPKKSVTELVAPVLVVVLLGILNVSVSYPLPVRAGRRPNLGSLRPILGAP